VSPRGTNRDAWVRAHPYLVPIARFCARVEAAASAESGRASLPEWEDYAADFHAGVPLLKSADAEVDLEPGGRGVLSAVERLAADPTGDERAAEACSLGRELRGDPHAPRHVVDWLMGEPALASSVPGLLRYVGWTAMAAFVAPILGPFAAWRNEEKWLRNYCPMCGSGPAMAQLVGNDPGRMRFLSCGCCRTRWRYSRTGCPFCEADARRLSTLTVEGEAGLRIDFCELCKGYLKTYDGEGDEAVLLLDWTSLHLDVVALDRGLKPRASSLYALDALTPA